MTVDARIVVVCYL